jgi:hypothetical protein
MYEILSVSICACFSPALSRSRPGDDDRRRVSLELTNVTLLKAVADEVVVVLEAESRLGSKVWGICSGLSLGCPGLPCLSRHAGCDQS